MRSQVQVLIGPPSWGISSAGRAPALHAGGQRFDPAILHHIYYKNKIRYKLLYIKSLYLVLIRNVTLNKLVILSNMIFKNIMLKSLKFFRKIK